MNTLTISSEEAEWQRKLTYLKNLLLFPSPSSSHSLPVRTKAFDI